MARRSVVELIFVFIAAFTLFVFTFNYMSMDGILPGNDPAVHLEKAKTVVINERITYSEVLWYPPYFHTFLAILLLFAGTSDVMVATLLLKFMVSTCNVLLLLSTYLLCRRLLGKGVAITSMMFIFLSVSLFEMISWGGYPNFLGIAYIPFIFYIMNKECRAWIKPFLLFILTFTLVLTHQVSAFVFLLVFFSAFLVESIKSKRAFFAFVAVLLGCSLAILAWYAELILPHSNILVQHLFFSSIESVYSIPSVGVDSLIKIFGATLTLALFGLPLTFVLLKRRKKFRAASLFTLWIAIPFFLSQSYLIGLFLPYDRFIYFMAIPIAIFAGVATYSLAKAPTIIAKMLRTQKNKTLLIAYIFASIIIVSLFSFQFHLSLQRLQNLSQYYEVSGANCYNAGMWLKENYISDGKVVVSNKPGNWFGAISNHNTTVERWSPFFDAPNVVADTVLGLFYEVDNTRTLSREYVSSGSITGQFMYVSFYNVWKEVLSIPDDYVYIVYRGNNDKEVMVSLSETVKETYRTQAFDNESQIVAKYSNDMFTLEKRVTVCSSSPLVNLHWRFIAHQDIAGVNLRVFTILSPSLESDQGFLPGVLDWQNPWDKPSYSKIHNWAIVECPPYILTDNYAAVFDAKNGVLVVFKFTNVPNWLNVGAVDPEGDRLIDAFRVGYKFDDLEKNESREASFSIFLYAFESIPIERPTQADLKQFLDYKVNSTVQGRDFLTYIKEYNIKFVVVDVERLPLDKEFSPFLQRVYSNDKFVIYAVGEKISA